MNELTAKDGNKDNRKNSMLLPSSGRDRENMLDTKIGGGSLAAAGSNVIGGEANYKRF